MIMLMMMMMITIVMIIIIRIFVKKRAISAIITESEMLLNQ